uniref:Putative RNA-directed DNA polymerase n=1 Tax=Schizaphis graminum TaxID=13262 RepID=A0A2S2N6A3_SCHGA
MLFNLYTNDQPTPRDRKHFLYADDLAITAQDTTFDVVEKKLTNALKVMTNYYDSNQLKPNPNKTQVCYFHLRNRDAKKHLNIEWLGKTLHNTDYPVYLGVTLDRTLTFKEHCSKTKMKVQARNNPLRKLAGSHHANNRNSPMLLKWRICVSSVEVEPIQTRQKCICSSERYL